MIYYFNVSAWVESGRVLLRHVTCRVGIQNRPVFTTRRACLCDSFMFDTLLSGPQAED